MLTQEKIDKIFNILRIVHTSHWKAPKLEEVQKEIERTGAYVFRAGRQPWVADIIIKDESVSYEINPELPESFKEKTKEIKKKFEKMLAN